MGTGRSECTPSVTASCTQSAREPFSHNPVPVMKFNLNVNSWTVEVDVDPDLPLLWALRGHLKLSEAAYGCALGLCDACTVRVDGMPVRSCITPVCTIGSARITTIESATPGPQPPRPLAKGNAPAPQRGKSTR